MDGNKNDQQVAEEKKVLVPWTEFMGTKDEIVKLKEENARLKELIDSGDPIIKENFIDASNIEEEVSFIVSCSNLRHEVAENLKEHFSKVQVKWNYGRYEKTLEKWETDTKIRYEIEFKQELERLRGLDRNYTSLKIDSDITKRELRGVKQSLSDSRNDNYFLKGENLHLKDENEVLRNLIEEHNKKFLSRKINLTNAAVNICVENNINK